MDQSIHSAAGCLPGPNGPPCSRGAISLVCLPGRVHEPAPHAAQSSPYPSPAETKFISVSLEPSSCERGSCPQWKFCHLPFSLPIRFHRVSSASPLATSPPAPPRTSLLRVVPPPPRAPSSSVLPPQPPPSRCHYASRGGEDGKRRSATTDEDATDAAAATSTRHHPRPGCYSARRRPRPRGCTHPAGISPALAAPPTWRSTGSASPRCLWELWLSFPLSTTVPLPGAARATVAMLSAEEVTRLCLLVVPLLTPHW